MNTTETNKKLAEFMGRKIHPLQTIESFRNIPIEEKSIYGDGDFIEDLKYHSDWNWLMLVWEAIPYQTENYCFSPSFDTAEIVVYDKDGDQRITTIYCDKPYSSLIEMIYNLCSKFVDWYNKNVSRGTI